MVKIAIELEGALAQRAASGGGGSPVTRLVAKGHGWTVEDIICTSGPRDRSFEEQHSRVSIAIVTAGSFEYHSECENGASRELMTPGSLLLGNAGQCFECRHEHGSGDRCLSFGYSPEYFETLAADAGVRARGAKFRTLRLPPLRELSPLIARAYSGVVRSGPQPWEELSILLAARTLQFADGASHSANPSPAAAARVTRVVRAIERHADTAALTLGSLAQESGLSPCHFLRTFERLTGLTPHQYILRTRLRNGAMRLSTGPAKVLDIAFDCGFGDVSNFNRAFRAEFGISPRAFRAQNQ